MNYNNAQLQQFWTNAHGDPAQADTMAAIALAESRGNPTQDNMALSEGNLGLGSWGLWQINAQAHPEYDTAQLNNPAYNASAAVAVYGSQGLGAWTQYRNGAYKAFLSNASAVASAPASTSPLAQFVAVTQTSQNPLVLLNNWITNKAVNVLYKAFALCAVLIVLGTIPQTSVYAGWAALCILFVLMIQQQPKTA